MMNSQHTSFVCSSYLSIQTVRMLSEVFETYTVILFVGVDF